MFIPMVVIEELDSLKTAEGEKGSNARSAIRTLEQFRQNGNLLEGVELPGGGNPPDREKFCGRGTAPKICRKTRVTTGS